MLFKFPTRFS